MIADEGAEAVGYSKPPSASRFRKGQSGNPRGRPKNRSREIPYDAILGQMVTIREEGRERRVTAAEAFLLQLTQKGLAGDSAAARSSLEAIEAARAARQDDGPEIRTIIYKAVSSGADAILDKLDLARLKTLQTRKECAGTLVPGSSRQLSPAWASGNSLYPNNVRFSTTLVLRTR